MTVVSSMASSGSCDLGRHGATCRTTSAPYTTCYNRFVRWRRAGVWAKIMSALPGSHDAEGPRTDIAYRQRGTKETTLRQSPLQYAADWRQDIDTAPAALRMTSSTTSCFDIMGTCEDGTSVVLAFMRFETKRCRSGGTVWSWVARTYQLGLAFHAVPSTFWLKRSATGAACVAYTSFSSAAGRSPAKCLTPLCLSQMRPSGTSRWSNTGDVGNLPSRL